MGTTATAMIRRDEDLDRLWALVRSRGARQRASRANWPPSGAIAVIAPPGYGKSVFAGQFVEWRSGQGDEVQYLSPGDKAVHPPIVPASTVLLVDEPHRWLGLSSRLKYRGGVSVVLLQHEMDITDLNLVVGEIMHLGPWNRQ